MRTVVVGVTMVVVGTVTYDVPAQVQEPRLELSELTAAGPVEGKGYPTGQVNASFKLANIGAGIYGNIRVRIFFCKAQTAESCYRSPIHEERIGELLSGAAKSVRATAMIPTDAQPGTRYLRLVPPSGEAKFAAFEVAPRPTERVCVRWERKGGKQKCTQWVTRVLPHP